MAANFFNRKSSLQEEIYREIADLVSRAEDELEPWPEIPEPTIEDDHRGESPRSENAQTLAVLVMAVAFLVVTIYAIVVREQKLLTAILGIAGLTLMRLLFRPQRKPRRDGKNDAREERRPSPD